MGTEAIELGIIKSLLEGCPIKGVPVDLALSEHGAGWSLIVYNRDLTHLSVEDKVRLVVYLYSVTKELMNKYKISSQVVRLAE